MPDRDRQLETAIDDLLDARAEGATICPSDAARRVDPEGRRDLMDATRAVVARLVDAGRLDVVQDGEVVDPATARGPIRIRHHRR